MTCHAEAAAAHRALQRELADETTVVSVDCVNDETDQPRSEIVVAGSRVPSAVCRSIESLELGIVGVMPQGAGADRVLIVEVR